MSEEVKDGGPAFPIETTATPYAPGMTLRDWFAGMAMSGALGGTPGNHLAPHNLARESYAHADAMLSARQQKDENDGH
jgi:uncharacterized protein YodC (DUF2158 family)